MGRIVPIPKTDSPSNSTSGYRPISILPVVSKVLERHVKTVIDDYLAENSPISCHQWGFMPHRSSTSALISVIHDSVADPGFTEGGFRTVMRATRTRKILGATPTFDKPRPQNAFRKYSYRGHVAT